MSEITPFDPRGRNLTVLMGGPGAEADVSLRSGAAVAGALRDAGARVTEVRVDGFNISIPKETELVFNLIHGTFGEDGSLQGILDDMGIPYTGEGACESRIAFDKILTKKAFEMGGVPTPRWETLKAGAYPTLPLPIVIKAPRQGSSVGVHLIDNMDQVEPAMLDCLLYGEKILVEELVTGRELTVGVLGSETLPAIEIKPNDGFYDYSNKYTKGATQYLVPAPLTSFEASLVKEVSLMATKALGLKVYCRVDILLSESGPMVLEINTIPGMTETSLLPKAAASVGLDFTLLCSRIAALSLAKSQ